MDLPYLIKSMLRPQGTLIGTTTVKVHPRHEYLIDTDTANRERTAFARHIAEIPNIESGLSWQLIMPWTGGDASLAMACIAIGKYLGLWDVRPDPDVWPETYTRKGSLFPTSGVIEEWPPWAGVFFSGDSEPQVVKTAEEKTAEENEPGYDNSELAEYLNKLSSGA